jgi:hypothetical protein
LKTSKQDNEWNLKLSWLNNASTGNIILVSDMKIELAQALWQIGKLSAEKLPDVAIQALRRGFDGSALRELAGLQKPTKQDIGDLFDRALKEVECLPISKREASLIVAKNIAQEIINGNIEPYEGARRIWWDIWDQNRELDELKVFVGLASGYEDEPNHQQKYANDIIKEARKLIV